MNSRRFMPAPRFRLSQCRRKLDTRKTLGRSPEIYLVVAGVILDKNGGVPVCPVYPGGLNRLTQHFILEGKDGV